MSEEKLLNEIGELFGRFRVDPGDNASGSTKTGQIISFTDRIKDLTGKDYNNLGGDFPQPNPREIPFFSGPLVTEFNSGRFYDWQKKVISELSNNKDVYVVAPPGGGKTTPLMAYWFVNMFLRGNHGDLGSLNPRDIFSNNNSDAVKIWSDIFCSLLTGKYLNGQDVPKVLFITPIRVLSFEQAEKFQEYFLDLILFLSTIVSYIKNEISNDLSFQNKIRKLKSADNALSKILGNVFEKAGEEIFKNFLPNKDGEINIDKWALEFTRNLITVKTGGGQGDFSSRPEESIVTIATYGSAANFISKIVNTVKFIVYDEAHLYQPSDFGESGTSQAQEITAATDAYKIIKTIIGQNGVQLAFLSGTINPVSADNFSDYLNKRYSRRMEVCKTAKGDPQAVNKTQLRVIPDDSVRNDESIINNVVRWVNREERGNAVIFFSKARIEKIVSGAKKKLSQSNLNDVSNRSSHQDRVKEEQIKRYRRSLAYTNIDSGEIEKKVQEFIKREFPTTQQQHIKRIMSKPGADQIENKDLRDAVAYGFGYIYTHDDEAVTPEDRKLGKAGISEKDKRIVADLFSSGKIYALLATPSIGVGVNVSIRNMYIPTLYKFTNNGRDFTGSIELNNKREMSQLINRAGRGTVKISGLYTPQEFVPYLRDITLMSNDDFPLVPAIDIRQNDDLRDIIVRLRDAAISSTSTMTKTRAAYKFVKSAAGKTRELLSKFNSFISKKVNNSPTAQSTIDNSSKRTEELLRRIDAEADNLNYYNSQILSTNIDSIDKQLIKRTNVISRYEELLKNLYDDYDRNAISKSQQDKEKLLRNIVKVENKINKSQKELFKEYHQGVKKLEDSISGLEKNLEVTPYNSQRISELTKLKEKLEKEFKELKEIPILVNRMNKLRSEIQIIDNKINSGQISDHDLVNELRNSKLEKQQLIQSIDFQIQKLRKP